MMAVAPWAAVPRRPLQNRVNAFAFVSGFTVTAIGLFVGQQSYGSPLVLSPYAMCL
jgi:hypothetical protein